jgi:stage II sporulation protein D
VYGGLAREHPRCNQAVEGTEGQILVHNGTPIGAFFHSNCGGMTEEIQPVWGTPNRPYLKRVKCSFGTADPRYHWTLEMAGPEILRLLKIKTDVRGEKLRSVTVKKKSLSGRAEIVTVTTAAGRTDMLANAFRIALHPEKVRSTQWTRLTRRGDAYRFEGRGWGHGVGMCQWGAKGQAERGRTYTEILAFYYPHTRLESWRRSRP